MVYPLPYLRFCTINIHEGSKPKNFKLQGRNLKKKITSNKIGNNLYYKGKTLLTLIFLYVHILLFFFIKKGRFDETMKANERVEGMKICKTISTTIGFLINMFDFIIPESSIHEIKLLEGGGVHGGSKTSKI